MNTSGIHLKKNPFSAAHVNKLIDSKNYDTAENILRKELKKKPNSHEALYLLGVTLWMKDNHKGALVFLQRAHNHAVDKHQIQQSSLALSNVYDSQQKYKLAVNIAEQGLKGVYEANKLTAKLIGLYIRIKDWGSLGKALEFLMPLKSMHFEALKMICLGFQAMGDIERAIGLAAEEIDNFPEASILLTQFYNEIGEYEKTELLLKNALKCKPGDSHLSSSLANFYSYKGRLEEAKGLLSAIKKSNNIAHVKWALGSLYLSDGDFSSGHELMEARYSDPLSNSKARLLNGINFNLPLPDTVGNILISKEEGLGDQIRHARYLSMLPAELKERVYVNCEDRLVPLFKESFSGIKFISSQNMNLTFMAENNITHQILSASTYLLAGKNMQLAEAPHLRVDEPSALTPKTEKIKIGLCWRSIKIQLDRTLWYMPLEAVATLFKDIDCELVSLQNNVSDEELEVIKKHSGKDLVVTSVDTKDDFLNLSRLINETDLVVATATATSELSAALGKKTWVITNKHPMRWYLSQKYMDHFCPDMRLYLNTQAFDWTAVADQVRQDLTVYAKDFAGE